MLETFLALLTAHLLGDFIFQNDWMVFNKKNSGVLLLHVSIISVVTLIILGSLNVWVVGTVFVSHFVIDSLKTHLASDTLWPFLWDQFAHIAVIVALAFYFPQTMAEGWWPGVFLQWLPYYFAALVLLSGLVLTVAAGGILIGKLTESIRAEIKQDRAGTAKPQEHIDEETTCDSPLNCTTPKGVGDEGFLSEGLDNGGQYIGWLERLLTLLFMLIGQPTAIGFVIAAKSVLRFGEIKNSRDRKLAEYIIIGTFLSFGWALFVSSLTHASIHYWLPGSSTAPVRVVIEQPQAGTQAAVPSVKN